MTVTLTSQRGQIGSSWLAVTVRDSFEQALGPQGRAKGKQSARNGSVHWFDVLEGRAEASVSPGPGAPMLTVGPWHVGDAELLTELVKRHPEVLVSFLAGEHSEEGEKLLRAHGLGFVPGTNAYVSFDCTCGFGGVCSHIYALAYCVVERIDEQPGDYLRLLGLDLDTLAAAAHGTSAQVSQGTVGETSLTAARPDNAAASGAATVATPPQSTAASAPPGAGQEKMSRFEPSRLTPHVLHAMMSDDVAGVFAAFYGTDLSATPNSSPIPRKDMLHD